MTVEGLEGIYGRAVDVDEVRGAIKDIVSKATASDGAQVFLANHLQHPASYVLYFSSCSADGKRFWRFKPFVMPLPYLVYTSGSTSGIFTGDQLRQKFAEWLSPPDPSENYDIARRTQHKGTAVWFIEKRSFREWKKNGCLLWIQGKRAFSAPCVCCVFDLANGLLTL